MPINFGNVNISLQQFQEISSGKYNAGEVKLTSETKIDKVNDHVTLKDKDGRPVSFFWKTTVALDGTSTITPLVIDV